MADLRTFFERNAYALAGLAWLLNIAVLAAVVLYAVYVLAGAAGLVVAALVAAIGLKVVRMYRAVNRL